MGKRKVNEDQTPATPMETARHTISPTPDPRGPADADLQKSHTKLFELIHYQELDLVIERKGNDVESLSGAFDLVRWDELNLAQSAVQKAIVRANLFLDSDLRTQLSIVRQEHDRKWNLILTLWLDCPAKKSSKNLRRAQRVGREVLNALHDDLKNRTKSLNFDELSKDEEDAVQAVARETLCQSGGHVWKKPLAIVIDDKIEFKLQGRMAAKPDHVNYKPRKEILEGKCRGFINDHKQRALLFSINDGNCVEIGFMESQVQVKMIDLLNIAELNRCEAVCRVTTNQTTDARGKHVYEFVLMEAEDPEPDLLSVCLDVNKNSDTEASTTHSNES